MRRKCLKCGVEFDGKSGSTLCPDCATASRRSTWALHARACRQCGVTFMGGPRAWYCPSCREDRRRAQDREYKKSGARRSLGSTDICQMCGGQYIVTSGQQKYCPDCATAAIAEKAREQAKKYSREHLDVAQRRADRHASTAKISCAVCGNFFTPSTGNPVTCSPECAANYRKKQYKRWEQAHREERTVQARERAHKKKAEEDK